MNADHPFCKNRDVNISKLTSASCWVCISSYLHFSKRLNALASKHWSDFYARVLLGSNVVSKSGYRDFDSSQFLFRIKTCIVWKRTNKRISQASKKVLSERCAAAVEKQNRVYRWKSLQWTHSGTNACALSAYEQKYVVVALINGNFS
jgi:hypothetical protein